MGTASKRVAAALFGGKAMMDLCHGIMQSLVWESLHEQAKVDYAVEDIADTNDDEPKTNDNESKSKVPPKLSLSEITHVAS